MTDQCGNVVVALELELVLALELELGVVGT